MRGISKKVLAAGLAFVLAVPTVICSAEDDAVEIPEPLVKIDMKHNEEQGMDIIAGGEIVYDDDMGTVLKVSASTEEADSEVTFTNPFAGLDLFEQDVTGNDYMSDDDGMPIWYDGVAINYWIKTADTTNSVVLNFRNNDRLQIHKDDWRKHILAVELKEEYDTGWFYIEEPVTYIGIDLVTGEPDGRKFNVYEWPSYYIQFHPDYLDGSYMLDDNGPVTACLEGEDYYFADNLVTLSLIGDNLYERFYEWDYDLNNKSLARYGYADGYFQISLDGGLAFTEDTQTGMNLNPNVEGNDFNIRNQLVWHGSVPYNSADGESEMKNLLNAENDDIETAAKWHMVTVVIQNDWIDFYIDGELFEGADMGSFNCFGNAFGASAANKSFNAGFGLRGLYQLGAVARADYLSGNRSGTLLVEWLALEETTFSIGGTNGEHAFGALGHTERVAEFEIDDISFYTDLPGKEDIRNLYEFGVGKLNSTDPDHYGADVTEASGDVNADEIVDAEDALLILKIAAQLETASDAQRAAGDMDNNGTLDANDALIVLKIAAQLI